MNREKTSLILILLISSIIVFSLSFNKKPLSHLHSWNQITTLTHIKYLANGLVSWTQPLDTITRISSHPEIKKIEIKEPFSDFRIYEEFPLYHVISALTSIILNLQPENAGRIISILCFILGGFGLFKLCKVFSPLKTYSQESLYSLLLWSSSYPITYYGSAIMSDIMMTAFMIWSAYFFILFNQFKKTSTLITGLLIASLASLSKSYGILAVLPYILLPFIQKAKPPNQKIKKSYVILLILSILPVIVWHSWTLQQAGAQEVFSHSLSQKLNAISSPGFILSLQKYFFRYLSYLPGVVFLYYSVIKYGSIKSIKNEIFVLLLSWIIGCICYLIFTADKIEDHDYYLLPLSPGLFLIAGFGIKHVREKIAEKTNKTLLISAITALIYLSPAPINLTNLIKALKENPDVIPCAELLKENVPGRDLSGILTDSGRFNSITYYGERFGLKIENTEFPVSHYMPYGIKWLLINLPEEEYAKLSLWVQKQPEIGEEGLRKLLSLYDSKKRSRTCALFSLKENEK
ncbi:MAG TPA: glycosyltransferase family 39 protein [Oligoflexia bacterium]|nr:glycosyltransferase family 39 protein [Oligoflexia bacterium]HMP49278.1 glycosyltransferase family 39 protein [Oligoflexia bacterium]